MLGRMDRYVAASVVSAYLATGVSFIAMAILFNLLVNAGKHARQAREAFAVEGLQLAGVLGEYYACWVPVLFLHFAPYITVIACMFGVTKLTAANELVPMIFSGRSMFRVLRPALLVAVLSAFGMAALWQVGSPALDRFLFLNTILEDEEAGGKHVLVRGGTANEQILLCSRYDAEQRVMEGVILLDRGLGDAGASILRADRARWDDERAAWVLDNGRRQNGNRIVPLAELSLASVTPDIVRRLSRGADPDYVQMLSYSELAELRELRPGRHDLTLAYHLHFASPLACVILVLLTLTLAVHFERGSKIGRVIGAIFVCAAFLVFDLACRNLGLRQFVHPVVAAWTPSIVFGALGVLSYSGIKT